MGAILVVLALGLTFRLIIAYLLPGSGFDSDLSSFRAWAINLFDEGLYGFYERAFFHDYTPGYLYVLWLVGAVGSATGGVGDLIKIPPILADLGIAWLVWSMVRELGGRERLALLAAVVVVVNPVFWFDSVVWGQVDSFGVLFLLLALRELWRDHPERSAILTVIAALIKPQLGILIPLVAVVTIRRALWPIDPPEYGAGIVGDSAGWRDRLRAWEARTGSWTRILTTGAAGYLTAVVLCLPFGLSVLVPQAEPPYFSSGLIEQIVLAGGGYPYLTVNAYNGWAMVPGDLGNSLANAGVWICDAVIDDASRCTAGTATFGPIPAVVVGAGLLVASIVGVLAVAARRPDRLTLLVALSVLAIAFFAAPTRVHERYGFPFFALGAILFAISFRWRIAYIVMSAATFANMYVVLTTLYPPADPTTNPVVDWLGIGESLRSEAAVVTMAVLHTAVFVWAIAQLRRGAHDRLTDELAEAGREPPSVVDAGPTTVVPPAAVVQPGVAAVAEPPAAAVAVTRYRLPTWLERRSAGEVGWIRWVRDRLDDVPFRADRSRTLGGERGGRFDRLDVWCMVVLIALTLGVRTFRLAEPTMMKFDEVYHARTAAEFLQHWRYGESHDIYEWTHPHLAKYAMAVGLMVFGDDEVSATSDLGVTVRGAAVEPRREDILFEDWAGERVHIATGDGIRTYDLRSRALVSAIASDGATAVAVDGANGVLIVGSDAGAISTVELDIIGVGGVETGIEPARLTDLDHPVERLLVSADGGTVLAASDERLSAVDIATGTVRGVVDLPGIADLAQAGTGAALVGTPSAMDDPDAVATLLADILDGERDTYLAIISGAADPDAEVVLGTPGTGDARTALDAAITDGSLTGVQVVDLPRVAVATDAGVAFLDPATARVSSTVGLVGGAHGLAYVPDMDDPKLYVTTGTDSDPAYETVLVGGDAAAGGPVAGRHALLPGMGTLVAYDDSAQMIHILGRTPDARDGGSGWTVYAVDPHGDPGSVFSDTTLPEGMAPSAWAMDVESQYPTEDRRELLVFGEDGASAAVPVSTAAFAWRMPGVIAGVLMGLCLYVLARILFARRSVAVVLGALILLDGMFFTQSRIGMNDVYVGLFIMAAYTVFAAVWTGWWRGRGAFWIAMPVIGLMLGLALASKWVAAYAIGALVLLLLVRSALGRVLAILGLIGITSVLGYMAIAVAEGQGLGNLPFLAIMVGLTLLAVVVAINHPIAWTDEEVWVAIGAPAVVAVLIFFGALTVGELDTVIAIGPLAITPLLAAIAFACVALGVAAAFHVGGRLGYGPFAAAPTPDDPASLLPPPAAPPDGWLRPGTMLGLPLVWAAACLAVIPLGVYIVSYIPWALIGDHQLWTGVPAGHSGQTLLDLTGQMYRYHDGLTSPHAASSPWWAWPFDLKPVWFYQDSFAAATTAAEYGAGNLVIWWMGVPALAFVAYMAYRRRSLALALIAIGFAGQWVPWARIDRAAFQYHYFTALPFVLLSLAYFIAELWHGAARRTWLIARLAAGAAIVAPALMWLFLRPICALVGVESVNPGSRACPAVIPDAVLTYRVAGLIVVAIVGAFLLGRAVLAIGRPDEATGKVPGFRSLLVPGLVVAVGFFMVAFLPDTPIFEVDGVPVEPIALIVLVPLTYLAAQVVAARDARRFVGGLLVAAASWFAIWYPNIAALPLPTAVVNAYQGLLPTYLYEFQFPVGAQEGAADSSLFTPTLAILTGAIVLTCLAVAYSASVWRLANAESAAAAAGADPTATGSDDGAGGLARTGGA